MTLSEIIDVCCGYLLCGNNNIKISSFSTDTRTIKKYDCYIALHGDKYDGNTFINDALKNGASICITDKIDYYSCKKNQAVIKVDDTLSALKSLAKYKREKSGVDVIAITGSNGKTTTKDLVSYCLSKKYKVLKTSDNNNNVIGLSKTILSLKDEKILVLEVGMNHMHEIEEMSYICMPDIAVVTNIGYSHIGNLGSLKNIFKAKLEIIKYMKNNGTLIINGDDKLLRSVKSKDFNIITYGMDKSCNYFVDNFMIDNNLLKFRILDNDFLFNSSNKIYLYSVLASYIISKKYGVSTKKIYDSFFNFKMPTSRCEIVNECGITIINDCYNASYDSMKSSIDYLSSFNGRKIAVLGDMLELGKYSKALHKKIGDYLNRTSIDIVITVGTYSKNISNKFKNSYHFNSIEDAVNTLNHIKKEGDVILIKASNKMNFSLIISSLRGNYEKN